MLSVAALEAASYPADEAASLATLQYRAATAAPFFRCLVRVTEGEAAGAAPVSQLVGFVNATLAVAGALTHDSMSNHIPSGTLLCIHSVVVAAPHQRRGLATWMLTAYCASIRAVEPQVEEVRLITHAHNVGLYSRCGFKLVGASAVVHGSEPWMEMVHTVRARSLSAPQPPVAHSFSHVDAFTLTRTCPSGSSFSGNPAGVLLLTPRYSMAGGANEARTSFPDAEWMQRVAVQTALPVTAFVAPALDGTFHVRYFSCTSEMAFCGHASLATAHALWSSGFLPAAQRACLLHAPACDVHIEQAAQPGSFIMTLPSAMPSPVPAARRASIMEALPDCLGLPAHALPLLCNDAEHGEDALRAVLGRAAQDGVSGIVAILANALDVIVVTTPNTFAAMVANPHAFAAIDGRIVSVTTLTPRGLSLLRGAAADASVAASCSSEQTVALASGHCAGAAPIIVSRYDVLSRCFSPRGGTPEDAACGAAHCGILPWWARTLRSLEVVWALQASPRGGELGILWPACGTDARVALHGTARLVVQADWCA
ncbi:GNAT family N-acetyltransferase [archaeon]|nr:MAG: GNAT family N-acetyltransferase [archaeon]